MTLANDLFTKIDVSGRFQVLTLIFLQKYLECIRSSPKWRLSLYSFFLYSFLYFCFYISQTQFILERSNITRTEIKYRVRTFVVPARITQNEYQILYTFYIYITFIQFLDSKWKYNTHYIDTIHAYCGNITNKYQYTWREKCVFMCTTRYLNNKSGYVFLRIILRQLFDWAFVVYRFIIKLKTLYSMMHDPNMIFAWMNFIFLFDFYLWGFCWFNSSVVEAAGWLVKWVFFPIIFIGIPFFSINIVKLLLNSRINRNFI